MSVLELEKWALARNNALIFFYFRVFHVASHDGTPMASHRYNDENMWHRRFRRWGGREDWSGSAHDTSNATIIATAVLPNLHRQHHQYCDPPAGELIFCVWLSHNVNIETRFDLCFAPQGISMLTSLVSFINASFITIRSLNRKFHFGSSDITITLLGTLWIALLLLSGKDVTSKQDIMSLFLFSYFCRR